MKKIELLAPAGGVQSIKAAVMGGADAVYIGGERFSARSGAENFSAEEMREQIKFCHMYGVRVHVAVNTLAKECETDDIAEYAKTLSDIGADAAIIQDLGTAAVFRSVAPELQRHASTQMTVSSLSGVKKLAELGFSRVVLARELSLNEIEYICRNSDIETEIFVHGALCMCYSGQCLMSSIIGGRSGNRGKCAQPCRLPYSLVSDDKTVKNGYLLSPKDLSLIDDLNTLKKIGVDSIKIEGRLKRPEYVAAVTGVFRRCIDSGKTDKRDVEELLDAFNRGGFTKGYFTGCLGANMMSGKKPGNSSDGIYSENTMKIISGEKKRTVPIKIFAELSIGKPLMVKITDYSGNTVTVYSDERAEAAKSKPITDDMLIKRLEKTGSTCYISTHTSVDTDGISILSASCINETRRRALSELTNKRTVTEHRKTYELSKTIPYIGNEEIQLTAEVRTAAQAEAAAGMGIKRIYIPKDIIKCVKNVGTILAVEKLLPVPHGEERAVGDDVLVSNIGEWHDNKGKNMYGDYRLNITNSYSVRELKEMKSVCISPELNLKEIRDITKKKSTLIEVMGYGRLTLMTMKNCPVKSAGGCTHKKGTCVITDRKNQSFPMVCERGCISELLNSKPLYMADKIDDIKKAGADYIRLVFTIEAPEECEKIIREYQNALNGKMAEKMPENSFTRGHFYRGVT